MTNRVLVRLRALAPCAARRWCIAGALLLTLSVTGAHAEEVAVRSTSWVCWYANGVSVTCRLGEPEALVASGADLPSPTSEAGAVPPAGKRPLPQIVGTILQQPASLAGRTISIPLFTEARDTEFVRELAEAVMCGTRKLCHVLFLASSTEIALALDAFEDPALN